MQAGSASSDPIVLDASDSDNFLSPPSSYVDVAEQSADSDFQDQGAEDSVDDKSSTLSSNDSEAEGHSSAASLPAKRKRETQQAKLFSGGQLTRNGAAKSKPARKAGIVQEVNRNSDSWTYKLGIDTSLPPLHDIEDIFYDLTSKGRRIGLEKALAHLAGRKLKVATMCSGTESPLLALDLISESKHLTGIPSHAADARQV